MSIPSSVQAVVFDMDGVLWLSSPIHSWAFREILADEGILDFDYAHYAGMRTRECLVEIFRKHGREVSCTRIDELAARKSRLALEALRSNPPLAPGCQGVIRELSSRVKVALASAGSSATVDLFLDASGCRKLFAAVLSGSSVERPKPAPDIYRRAAELLAVAPPKVVVVEDAVAGVRAGRAAGALVWAISTTCPAEVLAEAGADRIIFSLEQLL